MPKAECRSLGRSDLDDSESGCDILVSNSDLFID